MPSLKGRRRAQQYCLGLGQNAARKEQKQQTAQPYRHCTAGVAANPLSEVHRRRYVAASTHGSVKCRRDFR
jgi:hypothetical protein